MWRLKRQRSMKRQSCMWGFCWIMERSKENKVLMRRQKCLREDSSANQCHNQTFPISSLHYKDLQPAMGKTASVFKSVHVCVCVRRRECVCMSVGRAARRKIESRFIRFCELSCSWFKWYISSGTGGVEVCGWMGVVRGVSRTLLVSLSLSHTCAQTHIHTHMHTHKHQTI